jgi:hypothetical protein
LQHGQAAYGSAHGDGKYPPPPAWRQANSGRVSLGQLKVMSAIESCRTAALGGHVARRMGKSTGNTFRRCRPTWSFTKR